MTEQEYAELNQEIERLRRTIAKMESVEPEPRIEDRFYLLDNGSDIG